MLPAIRKLDSGGWLAPKGYSRTLGVMIACFVGSLSAALEAPAVLKGGV
jgi:hypothetical protein